MVFTVRACTLGADLYRDNRRARGAGCALQLLGLLELAGGHVRADALIRGEPRDMVARQLCTHATCARPVPSDDGKPAVKAASSIDEQTPSTQAVRAPRTEERELHHTADGRWVRTLRIVEAGADLPPPVPRPRRAQLSPVGLV